MIAGICRAAAIALSFATAPAGADLGAFLATLSPLEGDEGIGIDDVSGDGARVVGYSYEGMEGSRTAVYWDALGAPTAITPQVVGYNAEVTAVSADASTIVGRLFRIGYTAFNGDAWRWSAAEGRVPLLGTPAPVSTYGIDVSPDGSVIFGSAHTTPFSGEHAAYWIDGVLSIPTPTGFPDAISGHLIAAGLDGSFIGNSRDEQDIDYIFITNGTTLEAVTTSDLGFCTGAGASADGSVLVGSCSYGPIVRPIRWSVRDVSQYAYLSLSLNMKVLDVSSDGNVILGTSADVPYVWRPLTGFRKLADILEEAGVDTSGFSLRSAKAVSADGRTVVGGSFVARLPEFVPEPDAIAGGAATLLALGLLSSRRASSCRESRTARAAADESSPQVSR